MAPTVLQYFARRTSDYQRAFDLTAETFAKAYEKRQDFRGESEGEAAGWLWSIAKNELAHFYRGRSYEAATIARLELERPRPSDEELHEIERMITMAEARPHVEAALTLLPPDQQAVIQMRFVEDLDYQDIAERIGVSRAVVRARCSRALRVLRDSDQVHAAVHALKMDPR